MQNQKPSLAFQGNKRSGSINSAQRIDYFEEKSLFYIINKHLFPIASEDKNIRLIVEKLKYFF